MTPTDVNLILQRIEKVDKTMESIDAKVDALTVKSAVAESWNVDDLWNLSRRNERDIAELKEKNRAEAWLVGLGISVIGVLTALGAFVVSVWQHLIGHH